MDGLTLLYRARAAGLRIEAVGNELKIRGPKRAERVVKLIAEHKPAVLAALSRSAGAAHWRERLELLTSDWSHGERRWAEARRLAWGDLQNEWHALQGGRFPSWQCAGCQKPLGRLPALDLPDGNRVHFHDIECLVTFGRRWRGIAHEQLVACGLDPPGRNDDARWA
jgi:hypothetical protein